MADTTNNGVPQPFLPPRPGAQQPAPAGAAARPAAPPTGAVKPAAPTRPAPAQRPAAPAQPAPAGANPITNTDDLLASINRNFGGGETAATKAKRDSLAKMNKTLPDWNLEPPETFLP